MRSRPVSGRRPGILLLSAAAVAWLGAPGCRSAPAATGRRAPAPEGIFRDVAPAAGIGFTHTNGQHERYLLLQTLGGGCAFLDYDGDGRQDVLLVSPGEFPGSGARNTAFYRNLTPPGGPVRFEDVTAGSGLDVPCGYAQGVVAADVDNDGRPDVFISGYGGCRLFRNEGSGPGPRFRDVTEAAGVGDREHGPRWATSAAFGDYDHDGRLDLYLCHYAVWSPESDRTCPEMPGGLCEPTAYAGDGGRLYHNEGGVRFRDVTHAAGLDAVHARGLAVAWVDADGDGWDDIFVANDMDANVLFRNGGNGRFTNVAAAAGVAYGSDGLSPSGMGVAAGDDDGSGRESLFVPNLSNQVYSLFQNEGDGRFSYATDRAGLRLATLATSGFGCAFLDYDLDGRLDLVVANGHVNPHIDGSVQGIHYLETKGLFHNEGAAPGAPQFRDASAESGDMRAPRSSRGLSVGDVDNDGRPDVLCVNRNDRAELFHNMGTGGHGWLRIRLTGAHANRDGAGAVVSVTAGGRRQVRVARRGSSYGSSDDPRLLFGLGKAKEVEGIEVRWPGGRRESFPGGPVDREIVCVEGAGR